MSLSTPSRILIPFARDGAKNVIPDTSQIGVVNGRASWPDGFVPLNMTPVAAGGVPPFGQDFNGVLNALSSVGQYSQAGGGYTFDSAFSTAVGGYPLGCLLLKDDGSGYWLNTAADNTTDPDGGSPVGWVGFASVASAAEAIAGSNAANAITPSTLTAAVKQIFTVGATVAASALTITLAPIGIDFRSATLTSGTINRRTFASALSLVIPSGATLGTINATTSRLVVLAIDNAGTVELAVVNIAGGNNIDETGVISTAALSAESDIKNTYYSASARTNVPYRVVGVVESTQATAGTWATSPSLIQGAGGQAVSAMSSIGYGQVWTDVEITPGRVLGTTYYNTTGRPIMVHAKTATTAVSGQTQLTIDGIVIISTGSISAGQGTETCGIVPPGSSYSVIQLNPTATLHRWLELR